MNKLVQKLLCKEDNLYLEFLCVLMSGIGAELEGQVGLDVPLHIEKTLQVKDSQVNTRVRFLLQV